MAGRDGGRWVLVLSCPDRPGIVAAVAGLLAQHGANIVDASQHTDRQAHAFFMRVDFEPADEGVNVAALTAGLTGLAGALGLDWALHGVHDRPRLAVLVSRDDHCLYDLLLEAVELAKSFGGTDGHKYVNGVLDKAASDLRPVEVKARNDARRAG